VKKKNKRKRWDLHLKLPEHLRNPVKAAVARRGLTFNAYFTSCAIRLVETAKETREAKDVDD